MDFEDFLELIAQSMPITVDNGSVMGSFDPGVRDIDVFEFTIAEGEVINFAIDSETTVPLSIFDSEGNLVVQTPAGFRGAPTGGDTALGGVPAGTYYLFANNLGTRGSLFAGDYSITATRVIDLVGETNEDALTILPDGEQISVTFDYQTDIDTFAIDVIEGQVLSFDIPENALALASLRDANGNMLTLSRNGRDATSSIFDFEYSANFTGTIYLNLSSNTPLPGATPRLGTLEFSVADITPLPLNIIDGTEGSDTLHGTSDGDDVAGLGGDDKLFSLGGDDKLFGGDGNDILHAGAGDDELFGEAGNDRLYGITGDDYLEGGAGHDLLVGGEGQDSLFGGDNNDRLFGGVGDDYLSGGDHNDVLSGDDGNDDLFGDAGADRLLGGQGHDYLSGGSGNDKLFGGTGRDALDGDAGQDALYGQGGADTLNGGADSDILFGGAGNDYLDGGTGNDVLSGGGGADVFRYQTNGGVDRIVDFDLHQDKVDFSNGLIAFQDFDDVMDNAVQIGEDLHLIVGDGNRLVLEDINIHDIDADLFIFV